MVICYECLYVKVCNGAFNIMKQRSTTCLKCHHNQTGPWEVPQVIKVNITSRSRKLISELTQ